MGIGHDRALRDLEGESIRRYVVAAERHLVDEVGVQQAPGGEVHRHPQVVPARPPLGARRQGPVEHPAGEQTDQTLRSAIGMK